MRTLDPNSNRNGCSAPPDLPENLAALQLPAAGQEAHHADQASGLALCMPPVPASRVHPLNLHHKTEARPHSRPEVETRTFNNCTSSLAIYPPSTYSPQRQSSEIWLAGRKVRIEVISQCLTQGSRKATKISSKWTLKLTDTSLGACSARGASRTYSSIVDRKDVGGCITKDAQMNDMHSYQ